MRGGRSRYPRPQHRRCGVGGPDGRASKDVAEEVFGAAWLAAWPEMCPRGGPPRGLRGPGPLMCANFGPRPFLGGFHRGRLNAIAWEVS